MHLQKPWFVALDVIPWHYVETTVKRYFGRELVEQVEAGTWPWESRKPIHVVTAWNPGEERPGEVVNRARQGRLEAELSARGLHIWRTVGRDPTASHAEDSAAVAGLTEREAVALGARYGQAAIFAWSPEQWTVVSCVDDRRNRTSWILETLER